MPKPTNIVIVHTKAGVSRLVRGLSCTAIPVVFGCISARVSAMRKSLDPLFFYGHLNIQGGE
jgi:hypothetical protein